MGKFIDITGRRFGRLVVTKRVFLKKKVTHWECSCDCGNKITVWATSLMSGNTKSCGCYRNEQSRDRAKTHGRYGTKTYGSWVSMKRRCLEKSHNRYHVYGGRGIKICDRWLKFENFYADMGKKPEGMQLDRIDNNGNYEPSNCRWVSLIDNIRNKPSTRLNTEAVKVIKYAIKHMDVSISKLAELYNVSYGAIDGIKRGRSWKNVNID